MRAKCIDEAGAKGALVEAMTYFVWDVRDTSAGYFLVLTADGANASAWHQVRFVPVIPMCDQSLMEGERLYPDDRLWDEREDLA